MNAFRLYELSLDLVIVYRLWSNKDPINLRWPKRLNTNKKSHNTQKNVTTHKKMSQRK